MTDEDICPAAIRLSREERDRLDALPDAAGKSLPDHRCDLDRGHPDAHVSFVQSQDYGDQETLISWWVWWDKDGHTISARKECDTERLAQHPDAELCMLPTGHWGRHVYVDGSREEIRIA